MSSTYSAVSGNGSKGAALSITVPADNDSATAASVNVAMEKIADQVEFMRGKVAWADDNLGARIRNVGAPALSGDVAVYPVGRAQSAAVGEQASASSGNFSTASTTIVDVTNLSVTITTTGRPVVVFLAPYGSASASLVLRGMTAGTGALVSVDRSGSSVGAFGFGSVDAAVDNVYPPGVIHVLDAPAAGTYTYKLRGYVSVNGTLLVSACKLVAYEL